MPSNRSADTPGDRGVIVLRLGEIFLKGRNRSKFVRALTARARQLVASLPDVTVEERYLRILVHHPAEQQARVLDRLGYLFGMQSMSPVTVVAREVDAIGDAAIREAEGARTGTTFKVESNRRDKSFPLPSPELSRQIGARVVSAHGLPVDVHSPELTIHVEVDEDHGYVWSRHIPGPGGLPVGTGGKVGLLLSGGIDSPVAGWSMARRGCTIEPIYFHSFPFTGDKTKEKVLDLARVLARWHGPMTVHVVHFTEAQKQLRDHGPGELAVLLYRRAMMRTASLLARRSRALALCTGENLGQVASQTLANLSVIESAATLPVLRPLICYDKAEIISQAKGIGTFELSILPYDDACTLFVPKHPATRAHARDLERAEAGLDVEAMATALADNAEAIVIE